MAKAPYEMEFELKGYPDVHAGIVKWPMSVIRLQGRTTESIVETADHILTKWRGYSDSEVDIFSETDGIPHNTITPIARMRGDLYELDLVCVITSQPRSVRLDFSIHMLNITILKKKILD